MTQELTILESHRLDKCEQDISHGIEGVKKSAKLVGMALKQIHDDKLYRDDFPTFEEYCESRWSFTSRRARQLMDHVDTLRRLGFVPGDPDETGTTVPKLSSERTVDESGTTDPVVEPT